MATLLVVDDEFGVAELFEAILTDEGHRVLTATTGQHGLEVLARERTNLVFVDFMTPLMSGGEMLASMSADPIQRGIPVVVMSSLPEASVAERCTGYAAFMRKPFRITQVVNLAERLTRDLN